MPRSFLAVLVVALFAVSQTATTQPPQPVATSRASSRNPAPTVSLAIQPARQVFSIGERFTVVATASGSGVQYAWTVKNLETGVERSAHSTTLSEVHTSGRAAGKYEYKCVVTDSAGTSGEATLVVSVEDTGNPEVVGLAFDDSTAALHHVTTYWGEGFPAIRRGDWALMLVSVRNFIAGPHILKVFVDGKPVAAGGPGSAWAVQNLGGSTTERRVRLFVPPGVGVGKHSIAVAAFTRAGAGGAESETSRTAFSPEPLVLFNPWRSPVADVSVHAANPLSNQRATFYTSGTQDLVMSGLASKNVYDVTPYQKAVVALAQEIIASMPEEARADAARVAAAMATYVGDRVLVGKWPGRNSPDPFPNAIKKPWEWRAASEVSDEYLKTKQRVSFAQSWVYSFTLTALLRSVGIPAREISVLDSGRDLEAEWGVLQTRYDCKRWNGTRCEDPQTASSQEQLSFHSWNEVWIPSVNPDDGWAAVDATPQPRTGGGHSFMATPSLKAVREFAAPPRGQQLPAGDDAFLFAATKLPWEIWWRGQDTNWYQATGATPTATHGFVSDTAFQRSDELRNYGVVLSEAGPSPKGPALQITAGPVVSLRTNTTVRIVASGLGAQTSRLGFALIHLPRELSGGTLEAPLPGGLAFVTMLDVRPSAGGWTGVVEIPGDVLSVAGSYEVAVGPQQGAAASAGAPSGRARLDVRGLPIALAVPAHVNAGATFAVSARLVNSTSAPVQGATLRLVLPNQLRVVGGTNSGAETLIPPAGDVRVDAMVQALTSGTFLVGAASESSAGSSEEHAPVVVSRGGVLSVAGEPALGIKPGETVTVAANVILDGAEAANEVEARLETVAGAPLTVLSDARKVTSTLAPGDSWTPSWQVLVTTPGTYRLPVRVRSTGLGEAVGEIVLLAGTSDPDADTVDDFADDASLGYRSPKAIAGVAAVLLGLVGLLVYLVRRRRVRRV
ncbi:MAG TPA: transglutaminase domain-containing protein [Vicinamibacterales bacterium]|nr:transglutaminase domain-containing protein [Vicinamibacterales bacterium]